MAGHWGLGSEKRPQDRDEWRIPLFDCLFGPFGGPIEFPRQCVKNR